MNTPKAPSPWPPRVWIAVEEIPLLEMRSLVIHAKAHGATIPNSQCWVHWDQHTHLLAEAVREAKLEQLDEWIDLLTKAIMTERGMPLSARGEGAQDCRIDFISILKSDKKKLLGPELPTELRKGAITENGGKE